LKKILRVKVTKYLFISILVSLLLTSNSFSLEKLSIVQRNKSDLVKVPNNNRLKKTEQLLIETADKISEGRIDKALEVVQSLIDINPNFNLAHMIHGDLLLLQSQNYEQVSANTQRDYENKISDLKLELSRRIESFNDEDKNYIAPKIKVSLTKNIKYLIFVDVKSSRMFTFSNNNGRLEYLSDYYISVGKNGYGKKFEGDKKTPIGTYFLENRITAKLPDRYGIGAYPISFPSAYDKINNFTGSGIWIHGTPSTTYSRPPQSSDGCIVLSNDDIGEIAHILNESGTPVIISDIGLSNINAREVMDVELTKNEILTKIQGWETSWQEKNIERYLGYYSDTARYNNDSYLKWTEHKRNVFRESQDLQINIEDISFFEYPVKDQELIVVRFKQKYSSNLIKNEIIKQQMWLKTDSVWSIIYEGGT